MAISNTTKKIGTLCTLLYTTISIATAQTNLYTPPLPSYIQTTTPPNDTLTTTQLPQATQVQWITMQEALQKNKENPKKIFFDLYTTWCARCAEFDKLAFHDTSIVNYINKNFYAVKLDAEMKEPIFFRNHEYKYDPTQNTYGIHELAIYLTRGKLSFPSIAFLDENLSNPQSASGVFTPSQLILILKFFGENYYKSIDFPTFRKLYKNGLLNQPTIAIPPSPPIAPPLKN